MGFYVDIWYIPMSECEISFCPLIVVWNLIPIGILLLIGVFMGYKIYKRKFKI